jgi:pyruvate/2-oxoglutarate dehydrogenase complex dihydrolipoamide dehydrogenase (E3) component
MSQAEQFDALILGTGQGGKLLAWHLGRAGRRVAAIERRWVGGSCPNVACLPSKNEIWSARVAHLAREAAHFGTITASVSTDMRTVRQRKRDMVDREFAVHMQNFKASGNELIMGSGRFVAPKTLEVVLNDGGKRLLTASQVFINVGTHAFIPDTPGLQAAQPLTHIEALELDYVPSHLIVIGGGYVGLEMAEAFRYFGGRVTVIEPGRNIVAREDADVSEEMRRILDAAGIEFVVGAELVRVQGRSGDEVTVALRMSSGERNLVGSDILVATGRVPNTAGIGLEEAGIALNDRGYIRVNERLETSAAGVWAIGECAGSPQFTHASVDDFRIIRDNLSGGKRDTRDRLIPYCMFTDPPLARVGLSETEAQRQGVAVRVAKLPMSAVLRAETTDETQGFMKALVAEDDDRILGFTMIGADACEVVATMQTAMLGGLSYLAVRDTVFAHPTTAEGLGFLLSNVPARSARVAGSKSAARA